MSIGVKYAYSTSVELVLTLVLVIELVKVGFHRQLVIGETVAFTSNSGGSGLLVRLKLKAYDSFTILCYIVYKLCIIVLCYFVFSLYRSRERSNRQLTYY